MSPAQAVCMDASLEELNLHSGYGEDNAATTVLIVPTIGPRSAAQTWSDGKDNWLVTILPQLLNPFVLEYRWGSGKGDCFEWKQLNYCGDNLVEAIASRFKSSPMLSTRPLFVFCHGLGGIIVKRAFSVLHETYYVPASAEISRCLSGIVFFGCPHLTAENRNHWPKLSLILRVDSSLSRKIIQQSEKQHYLVEKACRSFEQVKTGLPIFTACESRPTRIPPAWIWKREHLAGMLFSRTGKENEHVYEAQASHADICHVAEGSELLSELQSFLHSARITTVGTLRNGEDVPENITEWSQSAGQDLLQTPGNHLSVGTNRTTIGKGSEASGYQMIPLNHGLHGVYRSYNLPLHFLKPHVRNPEFHGRQAELEQLISCLVSSKSFPNSDPATGLRTFALCGVGGLGKTQIAVEFAHICKDEFEAIFILQAGDVQKLSQSFADVAASLMPDTEGAGGDVVVSKNLVLGWLSQPVRQLQEGTRQQDTRSKQISIPKWLVIFDNADDLSILQDFWPQADCGSILLTSRDPLAKTKTHVPVANGIDLNPFQPSEAGCLLRNLTGYQSRTDVGPSESISRKLSGLPLAIVQTAATIIRRDLSFEEFLELYDMESMRADFHESTEGFAMKPLYAIWSLEDLTSETFNLLSVMAFLDPDQISETLLGSCNVLPECGRLGEYPASLKSFVAARTELTKSSLIRRNRDTKELAIHRIIQDTVRTKLSPEATKSAFQHAVNLLYDAWPFSEFEHSTQRQAECDRVVAHVACIHRIYRGSLVVKEIRQINEKLGRLFMDFGWYQYERGNMHEARPYFESCEAVCSAEPEKTWITRGDNQFCFAAISSILNEPAAAVSHAQKCVEIFQKHDPAGWRLCQAYNELCFAYIAAGRYKEGVGMADLAIAGYGALAIPEYPDWAVVNKAFCLCSIGEFSEASSLLEAYLEYRKETFGPWIEDRESFKTGHGLVVLGKVRACQGRLEDSLELLVKALVQYQGTLGSKHIRVGALFYTLGDTFSKLDKQNEACSMFVEALQIYNERPKEYRAEITRTLFGLATSQGWSGLEQKASETRAKAEAMLERLMAVSERTITPASLDMLIPNWSK